MPTVASRRAVIAGVCGAACSTALTCCATPDPDRDAPAASDAGPRRTSAFASSTARPTGVVARTADIPVGGGAAFREYEVVVTQPEAGSFRAFTANCTHQGCTLGRVARGTINCRCHGSAFSIADGSAVRGPAGRPLEERRIRVDGDEILLLDS